MKVNALTFLILDIIDRIGGVLMDIDEISFIASLWIISIFGVVFFLLLWLLFVKRKKILKSGMADEEIYKGVRKEYRQFFYDTWLICKNNASVPLFSLANSPTLLEAKNRSVEFDESQSLYHKVKKYDGRIAWWSKIGVGICSVLIGICGIGACGGIVYHITEAPIKFDGAEYRVLKTNDLEGEDQKLTIRKNSLVGFERKDISAVKVGDIVSYRGENEGIVYIKRVVSVSNNDNYISFSCKSDFENNIKDVDSNISSNRYLGVYNGVQNHAAGITVGFVTSSYGIVTLTLMAFAIYFYTYCFTGIDLTYLERQMILVKGLDKYNEKVYRREIARMNANNQKF